MTDAPMPIGEDDLQAYVDDRLAEARRVEVEAYLGAHPDVAAQLAEDRSQRDVLRRQLAAKFAEPIPARLRLDSIRRSRRHRDMHWLRTAAAVVVLVGVGAAVGWLAHGSMPIRTPVATAVTEGAVAAYRTFVVEVAHPVEVRASDEVHLVQWLSKRLGRQLRVPDLAKFGLHLIGGRLLPAGSDAAAMLMYDDETGKRLTVYVKAGSTGKTAFQFFRDGDVSTFAWLDQGYGFAVSSSADRDRLLPIAEAVYATLDAGSPAPHGS